MFYMLALTNFADLISSHGHGKNKRIYFFADKADKDLDKLPKKL